MFVEIIIKKEIESPYKPELMKHKREDALPQKSSVSQEIKLVSKWLKLKVINR